MKKIILAVLLVVVNFLNAQKVIKKSISATNVSLFQIDLTNCFKLSLETSHKEVIEVEATLDGEYRKDLLLNVVEEGNTIWVNTNFQPDFVNPNDKLSAHKVISIALKIKLPKYKSVEVTGGSCNAIITGKYKNISVALSDGTCILDKVSENVFVSTKSGDIKVVNSIATIDATSKYGTVYKETIPKGNTHFKLMSITGNIYLNKTE